MVFLLLLLSVSLSAVYVQIGNGTLLNQCLPVEPLAAYSYSQSIYTMGEINTGGLIPSISFQYNISSNIFLPYTNQFSVYIGTTGRDRFHSNTDWVPLDSLTLMFQGELLAEWFYPAIPGQGWLTIPLTIPYVYYGESNLVIAVDENRPGGSNMGDDFYCTTTALPKSIEFHSMSINPDPANPPTASTGNPRSVRPNLRLHFVTCEYNPHSPLPLNNSVDASLTPTLSWQSDAWEYDVYFAQANQPLQQVASQITEQNWTVPGTLSLYTEYQWQVVAYWQLMDYPGPVWTFRTMGETLTPPQNLTAMTVGMNVRLTWQPPLQGSIVSYKIYRNQQFLTEVMETEYLDTTVLPNQTYWYYVEAVNYLNQISPPSYTVSVSLPSALPVWLMNCEDLSDFTTLINGWTMYDLDSGNTWNFANHDFPNEGSPMSWMVFNPYQTTPPMTSVLPHSGQKMLICLDSMSPPNNDWLISPRLNIGAGYELSFWLRSYTADYGLERFRFLISTTDSLPASFQPLTTEPWQNVPAAWTQIIYDLAAYAGQSIFFAWNCVSWDALALCLDDITIMQNIANSDEYIEKPQLIRIYPNPAGSFFVIESSAKSLFDLEIFNLKGQKLHSARQIDAFNWDKNSSLKLEAGIYLLRMKSDNGLLTKKLVIH